MYRLTLQSVEAVLRGSKCRFKNSICGTTFAGTFTFNEFLPLPYLVCNETRGDLFRLCAAPNVYNTTIIIPSTNSSMRYEHGHDDRSERRILSILIIILLTINSLWIKSLDVNAERGLHSGGGKFSVKCTICSCLPSLFISNVNVNTATYILHQLINSKLNSCQSEQLIFTCKKKETWK